MWSYNHEDLIWYYVKFIFKNKLKTIIEWHFCTLFLMKKSINIIGRYLLKFILLVTSLKMSLKLNDNSYNFWLLVIEIKTRYERLCKMFYKLVLKF